MDTIMKLMVAAFVCESLTEWFFGTWLSGVFLRYIAGAVGVVLAIGLGIDLFESAGIMGTVPFLGSAITGLIISRGSDFTHQVWNRVKPKEG